MALWSLPSELLSFRNRGANGKPPLEALVFEYAQLRGTLDGMDTTTITELAEYHEKEIGYHISPPRYREISEPSGSCSVSNTSGTAGIAYWINAYYKLKPHCQADKNSPLVLWLKDWVDEEYEEGRVTVLTDAELVEKITSVCVKNCI